MEIKKIRKKLLFISALYPYPQRSGLTVRIGDMYKHLAEHFELHLFVINPSGKQPTLINQKMFKSISFAPEKKDSGYTIPNILLRIYRRIFPPHFDSSYYIPENILKTITKLHAKNKFDMAMVHTSTLCRCLNALPQSVYKIIDSIDIWHQRYLDFKKIGRGNLLFHFRNGERELSWFNSVDLVIAISLWDRDYMIKHEINPLYVPVSYLPNPIFGVNNKNNTLLYAAGSGSTTIDAIHLFENKMLPIVKKEFPNVKLKILSPCPEIRNTYSNNKNIEFLPFVDNISDAYKQTDIVVIPLRIGSGLKIKVLESFSHGKPTIVSPAAAQGIPVENYAQENISIDPEVFAAETIRALQSESYRKKLSESGLNIIRSYYSPETVYSDLIHHLLKVQ